MKKLFFCLIALLTLSGAGNKLGAQTPYIGGSLTAYYVNSFALSATVSGGYEFNDSWAVGGSLGLDIAPSLAPQISLYARWTPWHNDVLFVDVKLRTEGYFSGKFHFVSADAGLVGSLRFRASNHVDIFADVVNLGARIYRGGDVLPMIGMFTDTARMGVLYRF